jgi:hypothetical protein
MTKRCANMALVLVLLVVSQVPLCCQLLMCQAHSSPSTADCACCRQKHDAPAIPLIPDRCDGCETAIAADRTTPAVFDVAGFDALLPSRMADVTGATDASPICNRTGVRSQSRPPDPGWLRFGVLLI